MEAVRKFVTLKDNLLSVILPSYFKDKRVELIVFPADEPSGSDNEKNREVLLLRFEEVYHTLKFDVKELKFSREDLYDR